MPSNWTDCASAKPASTLVRLFRLQGLRRLEYSFGAAPDAYGIMVAGQGSDFARRVRYFAEQFGFARSWALYAERFGSFCGADLLYFKIDQKQDLFSKLTIYGRYSEPIGHEELQRLERDLLPIQWEGPSPASLASLFRKKGPQGIGFEVNRKGCLGLSYYFKINLDSFSFCQRVLPVAFTSWGWPEEMVAQVTLDVEKLFSHPAGWLALEVNEESILMMKLDAFQVPLWKAIEFLQTKGLASVRQEELLHICQRLRSNTFNYVGISYDKTGFNGWKVYIAVIPGRYQQPMNLRIIY